MRTCRCTKCSANRTSCSVTFLAAVARPRRNTVDHQNFDGNIAIFPFTMEVEARRNSRNRAAGTMMTTLVTVNKEAYIEKVLDDVFPAIKAKWPGAPGEIFVQQNKAPAQTVADDPNIVVAGTAGGWNVRLIHQLLTPTSWIWAPSTPFSPSRIGQHSSPRTKSSGRSRGCSTRRTLVPLAGPGRPTSPSSSRSCWLKATTLSSYPTSTKRRHPVLVGRSRLPCRAARGRGLRPSSHKAKRGSGGGGGRRVLLYRYLVLVRGCLVVSPLCCVVFGGKAVAAHDSAAAVTGVVCGHQR